MNCDFCGLAIPPGAETVYPCDTFARRAIQRGRELLMEICRCHGEVALQRGDVVRGEQEMTGDWAACPLCRVLIDNEDPTGLAARARQLLPPTGVTYVPIAVTTLNRIGLAFDPDARADEIAMAQLGFWIHRR